MQDLACARCAHPNDDDNNASIPTIAFVSFWAGLLLAAYLLRAISAKGQSAGDQHVYFTPLRPESAWWGPVAIREACPLCGAKRAA